MFEQIHKKIAYLIVISRIFDVSWEWLFLFFCAFSFANLSNGGFLTACIFINCALTRAFFSKQIAVIAQKKQNKSKLTASIFCRVLSLVTCMLLPLISSNYYLLFLWAIVINLIAIFDEYFTFGLRYIFNDKKYISITRFNSIFNLGKRGSIVISSIIAYRLGANNWLGLSYIFILVSVFMILVSIITRSYFANTYCDEYETNSASAQPKRNFSLSGIAYDLKLFFPIYLFLMNLFFSSIALLLSRALLHYKLVIFNGFNIITFFYAGFVIFNIVVLCFDNFFEKRYKIKYLLNCYILTIVMSYFIYLCKYKIILCLGSAFVFGLIYGFTLSCFTSLTTYIIRGKDQNNLYATIDVSGRIGMVISQLVTGFLLDYQIDPLALIRDYGFIALSAPLIFIFLHSKKLLNQKQ